MTQDVIHPAAPALAPSAADVVAHPLDRATAAEFEVNRAVLDDAGLLTPGTRFAYCGLLEPDKSAVVEFLPGAAVERRFRSLLVDTVSGALVDAVVDIASREVVTARRVDPVADGQFPILDEEFARAEQIVHAHEGWRAAMARRGLSDIARIRACPLTAGSYGLPGESGRRLVRVLAFHHPTDADLAWAHPVDGVAAYVDLVENRVLLLVDDRDLAVPAESGNYDDPAISGPTRTSLRPIEITQPEGPSFSIDGSVIRWENWTVRVGFDAREGLTLHRISFADAGRDRPIVYRASIPEMVVPYGDPSPTRFWQTYFDTGEYLVGKFANPLELGCDCVGEIRYLDATITGDDGHPKVIPNAVCIHEEDAGVLWKHTDMFSGSAQTRRQRRLVISFFATVGNYDYGFFWYFTLDGNIECEVKLTGILFTSAYPGDAADGTPYPYATEVAPGLGAPAHQHLFSARLDMEVDGPLNAVDELDVTGVPLGEQNPHGNALLRTATRLRTEGGAMRLAAAERGRVWRILSTDATNRLGGTTGYVLRPEAAPTLLLDPSSSVAARAGFATKQLWVTRYHPDERYSAGDFVNQHPGGAGLPRYVADDEDVDGADVVLWHTFGPTHFPRVEDWPVMPVDRCGFSLRPSGFFDRNPTLDVPVPGGHHGSCHGSRQVQ